MLVGNDIPLYHNLLDCGVHKPTVGRSIALLIQSLDCYKREKELTGNIINVSLLLWLVR